MKKLAYISVLVLLGAMIFFWHARAAQAKQILVQTIGDGQEGPNCANRTGQSSWCKAGAVDIGSGGDQIDFNPAFDPAAGKLRSVTVSIRGDQNNGCPQCTFYGYLRRGDGTEATSTNAFGFGFPSAITYTKITFFFSASSTVDFAGGQTLLRLGIRANAHDSGTSYWSRPYFTYAFTELPNSFFYDTPCGSGSTTSCPTDVVPVLILDDELAIPDNIGLENNPQAVALCSKFPIAYLCDLQTDFQGLATTTAASLPTSTISIQIWGAPTSFAFFSQGAFDKFVPRPFWQTIQDFMAAAIWLTMAYGWYLEIKFIFHWGQPPNQ